MQTIYFDEWLPDQPNYNNKCLTAENVIPIARGYKPQPDATSVSDALAASAVGAISFKQVDGTIETFVGTATKLYRKNGSAWTDVTQGQPAGTYSSSTFWRFAVYGDYLIATNGIDNPQKFLLASDTEFSDVANAPIHEFGIVIRDTYVALNCTTGNEIQWSAVNDIETWAADCGGGSQPVVDGGPITGGTGGEFGVVLQEQGLTRMNFVGGDLRFTFDKIEGAVGCLAIDSVVEYKGRTFFLSDEGFQMFDGNSTENISEGKCTDYFFSALTYASVSGVQGALDPRNSSIVWRYPISGGNKLIRYNYRQDRWSDSDADVDVLHTVFTTSGQVLGCFDSTDDQATFTGTDRTAVVSTGDLEITPGRHTNISEFRGLVDAAHDITVGKKTALSDTEATETGSSNANGKVSLRVTDRYLRLQVSPTAAFTELTGIQFRSKPGGSKV